MSYYNQQDLEPGILKIRRLRSGRPQRPLGNGVPALKRINMTTEIQHGSSSLKNTRGRREGDLLTYLGAWSSEAGIMRRPYQEKRN